ncbi:hypothetical protein DVH24_017544 [Malus domestica]|uniref:Uncharacterized protein n=1 Tax=Malus domestica TaxID=3750 RepID=A0A498KIV5_MALDO|nr:hypothetical protein DVH24_017544 [Malus domestica]
MRVRPKRPNVQNKQRIWKSERDEGKWKSFNLSHSLNDRPSLSVVLVLLVQEKMVLFQWLAFANEAPN